MLVMLMKVLITPGHGNFECYIIGNWTCFSFLKTLHLPSVLKKPLGSLRCLEVLVMSQNIILLGLLVDISLKVSLYFLIHACHRDVREPVVEGDMVDG